MSASSGGGCDVIGKETRQRHQLGKMMSAAAKIDLETEEDPVNTSENVNWLMKSSLTSLRQRHTMPVTSPDGATTSYSKKRNSHSPKVFFQKQTSSLLRKVTAVSLAVLLMGWTQCAAAVRSSNAGGGSSGAGAAGSGSSMTLNGNTASSIPAHHNGDNSVLVADGPGGAPGAGGRSDHGAHHFTPTGGHSPFDEDGYWREVKAIIGGVLGFWGGVGGLGTMFLVVVLSQRYCCRKDDDKDDNEG